MLLNRSEIGKLDRSSELVCVVIRDRVIPRFIPQTSPTPLDRYDTSDKASIEYRTIPTHRTSPTYYPHLIIPRS